MIERRHLTEHGGSRVTQLIGAGWRVGIVGLVTTLCTTEPAPRDLAGASAEAAFRARHALTDPSQGKVYRLVIDGAISPASGELILDAIAAAERERAEALLLVVDTPGGLLESTRSIVKGMLASRVPIVVYVAPAGARAGSAGVFITLAGHIAAMAPGTNIGAAHPVGPGGQDIDPGRRRVPRPRRAPDDQGAREKADRSDEDGEREDEGRDASDEPGDLELKVVNDAVAFIRAIAVRRGRNVEWAERSVTRSASITASEAVAENVVDLVAATEEELLRELDGRTVKVDGGMRTLRTQGAQVVTIEKGIRFKILDAIANPNVAFILMILGMYGLFFELANPGAIFPGVIGGISLLLALFAFQTLPVNYVGLLLLLLALALFLTELVVVSHGILAIGGIVAFVLGATMLFESPEPALRVSWAVILPALLVTVAFFAFAMGAAFRARRAQPTTGREGIRGRIAIVRERLEPRGLRTGNQECRGKVFVHGELWNAVAGEPIGVGEEVEVVESDGLTLRVRRPAGARES
jgi:membrane-bound serine protease (ClpP class)